MEVAACSEHPDCNVWDLGDKERPLHMPGRLTPHGIRELLGKQLKALTFAERIEFMYELLDDGASYREAIDKAKLRGGPSQPLVRTAYLSWLQEHDSVEE